MSFPHPWYLLAGAVACAVLIATWRAVDARQRRALDQFIAPQLRTRLTQSTSAARVAIKRVLYAAAVLLLFAALAGPRAGYHWAQVTRRGNDIIFAVDTSRSMLTPDVKPNRLARAKLAIDDLTSHLNGDAVGLVAFAGSAFLECPLTVDYGAFHESLAALDTHIIPRGGTDITSAIHAAEAALHGRAGVDKILILVTDGEDLEGDSLAAAKAAAEHDGLKIFTVGVGSANGDLIPLPADQGGGFLRDGAGNPVKSRLDETALKALAAATGGMYAPLGAANEGLDTIYQAALAPLVKHDLDARSQKVYVERYQWPLAASLALLIASVLIGTRRRVPAVRPRSAANASAALRSPVGHALPAVALACGMGWLLAGNSAHASVASAAAAYAHGDFALAAKEYSAAVKQHPAQPILQFDAGTAAYRAGDYSEAARAFEASVDAEKSGNAKRLAEQQDAYYNLGNTLYREGQKTEKADSAETIKTWTQAVKAYDAALELRNNDADTKFNRDVVNRKLEDLKKQQQDQSKQDQSKQDQSKQDQSKQDQSKQGPSKKPDHSKPDDAKQSARAQSSSAPQAGKGEPQPGRGQQSKEGPKPANPEANSGEGKPDAGQAKTADDQRQPGGMSQQEARELLDSAKGEERHAPGAAVARNSADSSLPDDPAKDW
jgi:Ca-activated chloride channel family protein